jgi:hypothetical protein
MAESLYELLQPYLSERASLSATGAYSHVTSSYLSRLSTLGLDSLTNSEPQSLSQNSHSLLVQLQSLSSRSHKSIIASSEHLSSLKKTLPSIEESTGKLQDAIPKLDEEALHFSQTYNKTAETPLLDRRRKALLLARNADRLADVLELPALLSSAISSSSATATAASSYPSTSVNYASALDLNAHIKRLRGLYPDSRLVSSVAEQAEEEMKAMATNLITSLRSQGLKLASAMRTISWLRRIAPELADGGSGEGSLGSVFLVCRLANLMAMLTALEPLRELADQETLRNDDTAKKEMPLSSYKGQQTERYLKRYIEVFREQSFAIISMFRSIFPPDADVDSNIVNISATKATDPLVPLPSSLFTFTIHLVDLLFTTLKEYLPNIQDRASRDSLLTQVLYCAGSLGRLGGDFSMILALFNDSTDVETDDGEWIDVIRKHRALAGKLESMVGTRE